MSGAFACACSILRRATIVDPLASTSNGLACDPLQHRKSARQWRNEMLSNSYHYVDPANEAERACLESLIREDFEQCHPGETLQDVKRRASFSREDKGLLRDWMALATMRAAADRAAMPSALAA